MRMLLLTACLLFLASGVRSQGPAKAEKKTIPAADGVNIICEVRGQGDTALLFLHGWCGDREYWKNQVDVFAADYRIVTLDQAGHGESGKNRKNWTVSSLAADVESVVKALGLKRVILVGHSMGGPVSLMAAKRLPGTVVAVIGVDTLHNAENKMPADTVKTLVAGFESDFKGTTRTALEGMLSEKTEPELKKWLISRAEVQDQKMALGLVADMFALDQTALLKEAKTPVRCINSGGGYMFFNATDVAVNKKYADFNVVTIDAVGHYPMLEKPKEFNEKLREVLKEIKDKK
ncbi:MAG TPA: alpha/beta hydrolase [Gemmataceae bacterium]|nr:alpha/beta hydrolase [Gemmataceae bacterium]